MSFSAARFLRRLFAASIIAFMALGAYALPFGGLELNGTTRSNLHIEITGETHRLFGYTVGLYDLSQMTAAPDDPDFQIQALQADRTIILKENGQSASGSFSLNLGRPAELGIFLLRDASLRDFSLGQNEYSPIFSTFGAPGSNFFTPLAVNEFENVFSVELSPGEEIEGSFPGFAPLDFQFPGLMISLSTYEEGEYNLLNDMNPRLLNEQQEPVVPEPATMALVALGLSGAAALRRRRS